MEGTTPAPLYVVYQAGDLSVVCFRAVTTNPAHPSDFLSHADLGTAFEWHMLARGVGVSAWENQEKAAALARRKGYPYLAQIDLAQADSRMPWARTGADGHVTIWAPGALILQAVVQYVDIK